MQKHKVLVGFLGVAVLAAVLLVSNAQAEAKQAYAVAEVGLGTAVEKIMGSNMPVATKDKLLGDIFADLPAMSNQLKVGLTRSQATDNSKASMARMNVCKGLFRAFDSTKNATAKSQLQQHLTDRSCTR